MSSVNEKDYEMAFDIILHAGESRSKATEAINACKAFDFGAYEKLIQEAQDEFIKCHGIQTGMLNKEAEGKTNKVNIILVHAQDHLTMANMAIENAKHFYDLYLEIKKLKERV